MFDIYRQLPCVFLYFFGGPGFTSTHEMMFFFKNRHRAAHGAPWTIAVTSPAALAGCEGVRAALAETGREFEAVLGGRLPADAASLDVGAAVASAVLIAKRHNFSGYNIDDETECAPRSTLTNFTSCAHFCRFFSGF